MICDNVENLGMLTDQLSVLRFEGREYTRAYGVLSPFMVYFTNSVFYDIIDKVFFVTS